MISLNSAFSKRFVSLACSELISDKLIVSSDKRLVSRDKHVQIRAPKTSPQQAGDKNKPPASRRQAGGQARGKQRKAPRKHGKPAFVRRGERLPVTW